MKVFLEKYNRISVQAKAALWFTFCNFLQKGVSFITVPIFTRLMSTEEYGVYYFYTSWFQILLIVTSLYLFNGVFDNAMSKFPNDRDKFVSSIQGLSFSITMIVFLFFIITNQAWVNALGLPRNFIVLMFIDMLVSPSLLYWSARQRFEYKYKRLVCLTLCKTIINPCLGLAFVFLFTDKALGRVFSIVLTNVIFDLVLMIYQFFKGKIFFDRTYWKYAIKLAIPLIPHYLSGMILNQGDKIVIDWLVGKSAVAIYGIAYSIGMIVQIFVNAISSAVTPWLYENLKDKKIQNIRKQFSFLFLIMTVIITVIILISPELVMIFGGIKYFTAVYIIPPVAASMFFVFLYGILAFPEFFYEDTKYLMFASIGAAILNIILNIIFIKVFGFVAAGYTTLICYIVYSVGHYLVGSKILKKYTGENSLVDGTMMFRFSLYIILVCVISNFIIHYIILRYAILISIIVIVILNYKKIIFEFCEIKKGSKV